MPDVVTDRRERAAGRRRGRRRLAAARVRAEARLTVPCTAASRQFVAAARCRPMVDLDLWMLHVAYAHGRDPGTLTELVEEYRPYALNLAKRHYRRGESLEDLDQVALESLVRALDRFEPERGLPFLAYAKPTIEGTIRRHYRDAGWSIRVPRRVHELAPPIREATEWLSQDLGRAPTTAELADVLGVTETEIDDTRRASDARRTTPVDPGEPGRNGSQAALAVADRDLALAETRLALAQCLDTLSDDDRALVHSYYVEQRTQSDIAAELGCSQMQVSRLLRRVVARLRAAYG